MTTQASGTGQQSAKDRAGHVAGSASEHAGQVAGTAKEQAAGVAGSAKEQAADVVHDAAGQARNLLDELRANVRDQVGTQRGRLAEQLDGIAGELRQMAERSEADGPATEAVRQVATRLSELTDYLAGDGDVAQDVRRFARRRPGAFLLACAAAGMLAGRATRGAAAARSQESGGRHVIDVREQGAGLAGDISGYRTTGTGAGHETGAGHGTGAGYGTAGYGTAGYGTADYGTGDSGTAEYGTAEYGTGKFGTQGGYRVDEGEVTAGSTGRTPGTAAGEPTAGIERTSDPNLRPTSGPLADRTEGYRAATGDPVPPDLGPGPDGTDRGITEDARATDESGAWERGER